MAVLAVRTAGNHRDIAESSVMIVAKQNARLGIDRNVDVRPAVVIEIVRNRGYRIPRAGLQDAGFRRNIGERPVSIVAVEHIRVAGQTARATHHWNPLPLAHGRIVAAGILCGIKLDVVADKQVEMTVAIEIEECASGSPANLRIMDSRFVGNVGKRAVAVVVKKDIVSPETAEQIVPAVVVIVANAHAGLPAGASECGFLGHIGKRAVAIVLEQLRCGRFAFRPFLAEAGAIGPVNIQPSIVVVIEGSDAASLCLDDVALVRVGAPNIGNGESSFLCDIGKLHLFRRRICLRVKQQRALPSPQGRCQCVHERAAENEKRRPEEMTASKVHLGLTLAILGNLCGTIPLPSFTAMIWSTGTSVSFCTCPLGHVISRESILVRSPRPKWMRGSLPDMYPMPPLACSYCTTPWELNLSEAPIPSRFDLVPIRRTVSQWFALPPSLRRREG